MKGPSIIGSERKSMTLARLYDDTRESSHTSLHIYYLIAKYRIFLYILSENYFSKNFRQGIYRKKKRKQ